MTGPLAFLLVTAAPWMDPADPFPSLGSALLHEGPSVAQLRVGWDPETGSWRALPSTGPSGAANADAAANLGGPELPFQPDVEFTLPSGGGGILLGRRGLEYVTVVRGKDGRFHFGCAPTPEPPAPPAAPTDR